MNGPVLRMIQAQGREYTVRNASGGGGRDVTTYSDDGTLTATLEQRGRPTSVTDSSGEEVEADLELRVIVDGETIREAGSADGYPTRLVHSDGQVYEVVATVPEDSGVTALTVVRA